MLPSDWSPPDLPELYDYTSRVEGRILRFLEELSSLLEENDWSLMDEEGEHVDFNSVKNQLIEWAGFEPLLLEQQRRILINCVASSWRTRDVE